MDPVDLSHDPSTVVHDPWKLRNPRRPDSVPNQHCFSCPARSTMYSSLPWLTCGTVNDCWLDSCELTTLVDLLVIEQWRFHYTHLHGLSVLVIQQSCKQTNHLILWGGDSHRDTPHEDGFFLRNKTYDFFAICFTIFDLKLFQIHTERTPPSTCHCLEL